MLLDHPVLVSDEDGPGHTFESISIFELKRPMRDNYDGKDNPIDQLQEYAEKIKEGNAIDATGRPIRVMKIHESTYMRSAMFLRL